MKTDQSSPTDGNTALAISHTGAGQPQWLTLKDASEFLGVHFTTLRAWADSGEIRVFRTPGGHRRFSLADLRRFLEERASQAVVKSETALVEAAIGLARNELRTLSQEQDTWRYPLDDGANDLRRQRGRQLFSLAIAYVLKPNQRPRLLEEGRKLGREYGAEARQSHVGLAATGRAVRFFRSQLIAAVQSKEHAQGMDADDVRVQGFIDQFLDEVLYAVLDGYEQAAARDAAPGQTPNPSV